MAPGNENGVGGPNQASTNPRAGREIRPGPRKVGRPGETDYIQTIPYTLPSSPDPPRIIPAGQAMPATHADVEGSAYVAQSILTESYKVRTEIVDMRTRSDKLKEEIEQWKTLAQMQRTKRKRIEDFLAGWQKTAKRMKWETIWGDHNPRLIIKTDSKEYTAWGKLEASPLQFRERNPDMFPELASDDDRQNSGTEGFGKAQTDKEGRLVLAGSLYRL